MRKMMIAALIVPVLALGLLLSGASKQQDASEASGLSGVVRVDGSSTVFPITEAVGEEFQMKHRDVRVTVGISGTGGGFKKFTVGETEQICGPGMLILAPAGVPHGVTNTGEELLSFLTVIAPFPQAS